MNKKKPKKVNPIPSIIPAAIFNNENLSDGAKVFYGAVVYLSRQKGYAFAGTFTLSKYLGRSTRSIQYYIAELYEKKIIKVEIKDGQRHIYPSITDETDPDGVASYIPPEILEKSNISTAVKLTYGFIQYKSANKNRYFGFKGVDELTELTNKSRSTIYRHLNIYKKFKLVECKKVDSYTRLFSFNSYQEVYEYKQEKLVSQKVNAPPDKDKRTKDDLIDYKVAMTVKNLTGKDVDMSVVRGI